MSALRLHICAVAALVATLAALALAACTSNTPPLEQTAAPVPMAQPAIPSQYRPEEVVGRGGYGAFHKQDDYGGSDTTMLTQVATLYNSYLEGHGSPLEPLVIQYADYAHWQRRRAVRAT